MRWGPGIIITAYAAEQECADVAAKRHQWRNWQTWLKPERLVFIDETSAERNIARLRGRSLKGHRLHAAIPWGHWKTTSFVAGLRTTGFTAPVVLDRAMNGLAFKAYVDQVLAPSLIPGDIVVMDDPSFHKVDGVRDAIETVGATSLYLPPHSPDVNPVEQVFPRPKGMRSVKLKAILRRIAARTFDGIWRAIGDPSDHFTSTECRNYFANTDQSV